jgi:ABC-2 type transport system ATP-binding protein
MNIIEVNNVQKKLGDNVVLRGASLSLKQGAIMGLIGANGAGKTTLLKTAIGLLKPDYGTATVLGEPAWNMPEEIKAQLGFVPQNYDMFDEFQVREVVGYVAAFYPTWNKDTCKRWLFEWELSPYRKVKSLSAGQKQRLSIVIAISHHPQLLVLDEPVASLDPSARREFINLLIDMNAETETSILFSTHITSDIERIAADIAFLKHGMIKYQGEVDTLKEQVVRLHIDSKTTLPDTLPINKILKQKIINNSARVTVADFNPALLDGWKNELNADISVEHLALEDIFLELS